MTTQVQASLTGVHSRSESLVKTSRDFDRGRASENELERAFQRDASDLIGVQRSSGFSLLSDGQLRWQDFIRPISESLTGLKRGADLSRWFDTNSFYRKPTVVGEIGVEKPGFISEYYSESKAFGASRKRKISIPGPYTLASLVEVDTHGSKEDLTDIFASILAKVIANLSRRGYSCVQINEPSLVYRYGESAITNRKHLGAFIEAFNRHISKLRVDLYLHTYFGDCSPILQDLLLLEGVSTIGIDFTQTALSDIELVRFGEKVLGCGCVDARNSLIESPSWISNFSINALRALSPSKLVILPSSDLKYLPRRFADRKIRAIGAAAKLAEKSLRRKSN